MEKPLQIFERIFHQHLHRVVSLSACFGGDEWVVLAAVVRYLLLAWFSCYTDQSICIMQVYDNFVHFDWQE